MKVRYGSIRLGLASLARKLTGRPDVKRWSDPDNFDAGWSSRSVLMAGLVPPGSRVLEFGAGRRRLEAALDPSCSYVPSDIVDRGPGTLVADLNARPLPSLAAIRPDVALFAGVLEYLVRVPEVVAWLAREGVERCVASYECAPPAPDRVARLKVAAARYRSGWINTYTEEDLVAIFEQHGYRCEARHTWSTPDGDERIFELRRADAVGQAT